ncbi:hypothetical protein G6F35_011500 [Rhizopus arrhizus]|nr:hypothetical protein G6F35_011500 [Rhizopus arrhizus]
MRLTSTRVRSFRAVMLALLSVGTISTIWLAAKSTREAGLTAFSSMALSIAFWSADLLLDGLDIKTAGANLPQSINYLPLAVGGALMVLFALNRAWKALQARDAGSDDAEGDR